MPSDGVYGLKDGLLTQQKATIIASEHQQLKVVMEFKSIYHQAALADIKINR